MRNSISVTLAWFVAALLALGVNGAWAQRAAANPVVLVDRILVVVNNEVITSGELAQREKAVTQQLRQQEYRRYLSYPASYLQRAQSFL